MTLAAPRTSTLAADSWLSATLRTPAFAVRLPLPAGPAFEEELSRLPQGAFCFAKVRAEDSASVALLESAGFRVIDGHVTFERSADPAPPASSIEVRRAASHDRDAVLDIAGSCFRFSRFHRDQQIGLQAANEVKRAWTANCLDGRRGEEVLVAMEGGRTAGFLAVLLAKERGDAVAVIDLVGVAARSQGRSIGTALVNAFIGRWRERAARLRVGTQASNVPSIRLYERCGFRLVGTESVLHAHRPTGVPA